MTVRATIIEMMALFTASERKIANAILADYPFAGLHTIQELAGRTGVSAPSITRFVAKAGFGGYHDFQRQLIGELKESQLSPLDLKSDAGQTAPEGFLAEYAGRLGQILQEMAQNGPSGQFDAVCRLLADPTRKIFILGGRISDSLATYLSVHLRQIRGRIEHLPCAHELWPEYVLRMRKQDVVVLFDFRRYQPDIAMLAETIHQKRKSSIILITDKWMSPVARDSDIVVALPIVSGTAWDTAVCVLALMEALIVKVSEADWAATRERIEAWDAVRLNSPGAGQDKGSSKVDEA